MLKVNDYSHTYTDEFSSMVHHLYSSTWYMQSSRKKPVEEGKRKLLIEENRRLRPSRLGENHRAQVYSI